MATRPGEETQLCVMHYTTINFCRSSDVFPLYNLLKKEQKTLCAKKSDEKLMKVPLIIGQPFILWIVFESDSNWLFKNFPFFSVISVSQLYILSLLLKSDIARSPGHIRLFAEKRE